MLAPVQIRIDLIRPSLTGRVVDQERVKALALSIQEIGLRTPITVRRAEKVTDGRKADAFEIVAGQHRYQAACRLGWDELSCFVTDDSEPHARLWEIDENLMRAELSPADRAVYTARRKAIYEELYPETRNGENQHTRVRQLGEGSPADRFTTDTASKTGKSERAVQRDATRGERIDPEVMESIRGTNLDKGTYLDALARLTPQEQAAKVERDSIASFERKEPAIDPLAKIKALYERLDDSLQREFRRWLAAEGV